MEKILNSASGTMVDQLLAQIRNGDFAIGQRLPTERQLVERFGISVRSVRQGIDELVRRGMVSCRQGSGMYVRSAPPEPPSVQRRDTVAIMVPMVIRGYHPYFSELYQGLRDGLALDGWIVADSDYEHQPLSRQDITVLKLDPDDMAAQLMARSDLAGAVIGNAENVAPKLQGTLPVMAFSPTEQCPYVAYDWLAETERAIAILRSRRARRIWVYGTPQPPPSRGGVVWQAQEGNPHLLSEIIAHAHHAAMAALAPENDFDGVVAGSDYAALGILDAMVKLNRRVPDDCRIVCLVNRESRAPLHFPATFLVSDGRYAGREMAALLNRHIREPHRAPRFIKLSCTEQEIP